MQVTKPVAEKLHYSFGLTGSDVIEESLVDPSVKSQLDSFMKYCRHTLTDG